MADIDEAICRSEVLHRPSFEVEPIHTPVGNEVHAPPLVFSYGLNFVAGEPLGLRVRFEVGMLLGGVIYSRGTSFSGCNPKAVQVINVDAPNGSWWESVRSSENSKVTFSIACKTSSPKA